jgi:hypothetical protein
MFYCKRYLISQLFHQHGVWWPIIQQLTFMINDQPETMFSLKTWAPTMCFLTTHTHHANSCVTAIHRTLYTAATDCNQQYTAVIDCSWFTSTARHYFHNLNSQAVNTNPKWRFQIGKGTEVSCPTHGKNLEMRNLKLRKLIYYLHGILAGTKKN